jgi:DNA (cytosine-5)-methyltransferase 1
MMVYKCGGCGLEFEEALGKYGCVNECDTLARLTEVPDRVPGRPKLLDLFCGAGGAAMGYHRAGFEVVGVDIAPQPHFPFEFIQSDWESAFQMIVGLWERTGEPFAIHASPPCQRYSTMTKKWGREDDHPDLVEPVRDALETLACDAEVPFAYVIENVPGAPLRDPVTLCGSMFGLGAQGYQLRRHRIFEASFMVWPPASCAHVGPALPVYGHAGGSSKRDGLKFPGTDAWRAGMGIDWMSGKELAESIPPAFTEHIGRFMRLALEGAE